MKSSKSRGRAVGLGIFSVSEARRSLARKDPQFLSCFTPHELSYCLYKKRTAAQSLSARMAAKLAFWDALGIKNPRKRFPASDWRSIEIESRVPGPPRFKIASGLCRCLGMGAGPRILVSLTHEKEFGMAMVLIEK